MSASKKRAINLLRGWPAPNLHPTEQLSAAAQRVFSHPSISTPSLQYGPDEGYGPLRTAISRWLSDFYSCPDEESRICITGGASQNLACVLQVFTDVQYTKAIWMVAPCYFLGCRIFEDSGFAGRLRAVKEDAEGIDLEFLEKELVKMDNGKDMPPLKLAREWSKFYKHIIYAVPSFSNPSGKTMSLVRRQKLVELARRYDALIITDDVYDFLSWSTSSSTAAPAKAVLPRLSDIDRALPSLSSDPKGFGNTISNASFSKIVGPGVRTGWTDSSPALSYALSQCGSSRSGGCPSQLNASIVSQLLESGELQKHINGVLKPSYKERWDLIMGAIGTYLVPLGVNVTRESLEGHDVAGGYFIWLRLPEGMDAGRVAELAWDEEELVVGRGSLFEVYGDEDAARFSRELRVCFAWVSHEDLTEGVERLGKVVTSVQTGQSTGKLGKASEQKEKKALGEFK